MTMPRPRVAVPETLDDTVEQVDRATVALLAALRDLMAARTGVAPIAPTPRARPSLASGGVVLLTDDGRGVARAVAADLRALGYGVVRVRHGVGDADVEGVNLTAAAAVAALVDRARGRGPIAAVVHLAPMRSATRHKPAWEEPDDARSLALLAQASADDLLASAALGGSCLIVARHDDAVSSDDRDRLSRWVDISIRTLQGVRVRGLDLDRQREPEVLAAEVVRATLGTDEPSTSAGDRLRNGPASHAILLGAPDRAAWIHLAAALVDWLGDAPGVRLADLAFTLHHDQPSYPFRVGLVARTGQELAARLRRTIAELAVPSRGAIHDLGGTYCVDPLAREAAKRRQTPAAQHWSGRLRGLGAEPSTPVRPDGPDLEALASWPGRDWFNHLIALRFARDGGIRVEALREGGACLLDLSVPLRPSRDRIAGDLGGSMDGSVVRAAIDVLDDVIAVRRDLVFAMLAGDGVAS